MLWYFNKSSVFESGIIPPADWSKPSCKVSKISPSNDLYDSFKAGAFATKSSDLFKLLSKNSFKLLKAISSPFSNLSRVSSIMLMSLLLSGDAIEPKAPDWSVILLADVSPDLSSNNSFKLKFLFVLFISCWKSANWGPAFNGSNFPVAST